MLPELDLPAGELPLAGEWGRGGSAGDEDAVAGAEQRDRDDVGSGHPPVEPDTGRKPTGG